MTKRTGRWEDRPVVWHDVGVQNCQVCGRLLLRQIWSFSDPNRGEIVACEPACEQLWFAYLEPRQHRPSNLPE
jgi:hypothetical protein